MTEMTAILFLVADEAVKPTHSVNLARTLSESKLDFSLPDKSSISTPVPAIDCSPARLFADLTPNDFSIKDSEKASIKKLQVLCERHDIQCTLLSKKDNSKLFLPSLKNHLLFRIWREQLRSLPKSV